MKLFIHLIFFLLLTEISVAQNGVLEFKAKEIRLENLKADEVPTVVSYNFVNKGTQPVIISRVTPSMSKMKADWDKNPVNPGASSVIKISFVSTDMPENFNYVVFVYSNASNARERLYLSANIIDNPQKPELLYKYNIGGLKFKSGYLNLDKIYADQVKKDTIYYFNSLDTMLTISTKYAPSHITCEYFPAQVKPHQKGMIVLTYDAPKKNDFGYTYENLILNLNNDNSYRNRISISANIVENFSKLSAKELANAPVAFFEKKNVEFGELKTGEKVDCDFTLENTGKSNLIIRKTKASCGCTAVALGETTLAPGQKTTIRATFNSAGKKGRQYKSVTVITNDPKNPETVLNFSGNVISK